MQAQHSSVPETTAKSTKWAVNIWKMWSQNRCELNGDEPSLPHLPSLEMLNNWLFKFVLKLRRKDGKECPPNTLYCICCDIMRHVKFYCPEINFFTMPQFHGFEQALDGEMKRLQAGGAGIEKKRAQPITNEEEEKLIIIIK